MNVLITIVTYLIIIIILVLVHELGHFLTARAFGVRVLEFGIGFPPRIFSRVKGETVYSINAIPLGGFVKLAGEEDPSVPGSLASKKRGVRILVLSAGALMNLLLPIVLLSVAFMVPHTEVTAPSVVKAVAQGSPAEKAGILPGDHILAFNGKVLNSPYELSRLIQVHLGEEITLKVRHLNMMEEDVVLVPRWRPPAGQGAIGVEWDVDTILSGEKVINVSYPLWKAVPLGVNECIQTLALLKNGIISMIIGTSPVALVGPVGIAQLTGEAIKAGLSPLLEFAALFSISIGVFNLFPLPALDGGRIAFVILEWFRRGKRISPKIEGLVHLAGFILLMAVMIIVTYQDILRIISGSSIIP